jgi:hypothetical protein
LERRESILQLLYLAPDQILATLASELHLLAVARSQVRFDVGAKKNHFEVFFVDSKMATYHGVHRHDVVFISYPWLLFSQDESIRLYECILFISLQQ